MEKKQRSPATDLYTALDNSWRMESPNLKKWLVRYSAVTDCLYKALVRRRTKVLAVLDPAGLSIIPTNIFWTRSPQSIRLLHHAVLG